MGAIERLISKFAVQTAICWKNNGPNGTGGYLFEAPIDIKVRWDGKSEIKMNNTGEYYQSSASVMTNHEVLVTDYLMLGSIADYAGVDITNPMNIQGAFPVIQMDKTPMVFSKTDFARTAWLFDYGK